MDLSSPKRTLSRAPFLRVVLPFVLGLAIVARAEQVPFSISPLFVGLTPLLVGVLLLPAGEGAGGRPVGTACRICPRAQCPGRHEPSILPSEEA